MVRDGSEWQFEALAGAGGLVGGVGQLDIVSSLLRTVFERRAIADCPCEGVVGGELRREPVGPCLDTARQLSQTLGVRVTS